MNQNIVNQFISNSNATGEKLERDELDKLNAELLGVIPNWYVDLISNNPLSGMEIGWQSSQPEDDYDGIEWIQILDIPLLKEINSEGRPGEFLSKLGYFIFGYGSAWGGNAFAFSSSAEDNKIYEVWHDTAQNIDEMVVAIEELKGVAVVAKSFSKLLSEAVQ